MPTHTPALLAAAVQRAAAALRSGEVVAVPTETVYGLAANALDPAAVARIFAIKQRPSHNPIIVHVASAAMAKRCALRWPAVADALGSAFWPGPLTLVVPKSPEVPDIVTAGGATVGIRWPQHPFMQAVIRACGFPLAAPSANLANRLSPTNARHVLDQLGDRLNLIVDGGECAVGIESTVVDLTGADLVILRPGMITEPALRRAANLGGGSGRGETAGVLTSPEGGSPLRSPGQLARHYSPRARLVVWAWNDEADLERQAAKVRADPAKTYVLTHSRVPMSGRFLHVILIPDDPEAFARALYAELHRCDDAGAQLIVVEKPPETPEWTGIADRLRRASMNLRD